MKKFFLLIFSILFFSSFVSGVLGTDLQGYFKGEVNGTYLSEVGSFFGTIDAATFFIEGFISSDYGTDGTENNKITLNNNILNTSGNFTVGFWMLKNDDATQGIMMMGQSGVSNNMYFSSSATGRLRFFINGLLLLEDPTTIVGDFINYNAVMVTHLGNGTFELFVNNISMEVDVGSTVSFVDDWYMLFTNDLFDANRTFDGNLDEIAFWDRVLNVSERAEWFNNGAGINISFAPRNIVLSDPLPINDSQFNVANINFSVNASLTDFTNCSLFINNSLNSTVNGLIGNVTVNYSVSGFSDGLFNYFISCVEPSSVVNTSTFIFTVDTTLPVLVNDFINNSMYFNNNVTGQFNFSDNILLHSVNFSVDGIVLFNQSNISSNTFQVNLSFDSSLFSVGPHDLQVRFADGHTAFKLLDADAYNPSNGLFNDRVEYEITSPYEELDIIMRLKDASIFDSWNILEFPDRFSEVLEPATPSSSLVFVVSSTEYIDIVSDPLGRFGGSWLIIGDHWKDFVLKDEPFAVIDIIRISDFEVEINISGISNIDRLIFDSTGDLNVVTQNFTFFVLNLTSVFDDIVLVNFSFNINLSVDFGNLTFDFSSFDSPEAILEWNGTNFSSTRFNFDSSSSNFSVSFPASLGVFPFGSVNHTWFFNFSSLSRGFLSTGVNVQNRLPVLVGLCNSTHPFLIINLSYFDEITDLPINLTNGFDIAIFDGTFFYNQTGVFENHTSDAFCTNLPPENISFSWDLFRSFTISKSGFTTRVVDIDPIVPILISNSPHTNFSLFLIPIDNSSTVKYTWFTSGLFVVDGTMRIFQCNPGGSRDLVDSVPIIGSVGSANIQLLIQPYAYDIIIDNNLFVDFSSFSRCHIENFNEVDYFVESDLINITGLTGLNAIDCSLEKTGGDGVLMSWNVNPDDSALLTGCITSFTSLITGNVVTSLNCTNSSTSLAVDVPFDGLNDLIIQGFLLQSGNVAVCDDTLSFVASTPASEAFGTSALFGIFLLVVAGALLFVGNGELQLVGAIVGLIAGWFTGVSAFGWIAIASLVSFLVLIGIIGRYSRQQ